MEDRAHRTDADLGSGCQVPQSRVLEEITADVPVILEEITADVPVIRRRMTSRFRLTDDEWVAFVAALKKE